MVDVVVMLNRSQQWAQTFDVLVHELAHLLLGHVGVMKGHRQGRLAITSGQPLTTEVMEFEVFSVGLMVALRRGAVSTTVKRSLAIQYLKLRRDRLLDEVNVLEVFVVAEVLCWWCASGPHRSSVLSNPRTGPVRPVGSSTKNPAAPQDMAKAVVSGRHESGENEKLDL